MKRRREVIQIVAQIWSGDVKVTHRDGEAEVDYNSMAGEDWLATNIIRGSRKKGHLLFVDSKYVAQMIHAMKRDGLDVLVGE